MRLYFHLELEAVPMLSETSLFLTFVTVTSFFPKNPGRLDFTLVRIQNYVPIFVMDTECWSSLGR
jgi:hypothetical protein